jgi:antitoxin (DNA-binding transcriptional repressor) of toxin-antitoxin stability system
MRKVGSREFKNRMGRYLSAVKRGQSILIYEKREPMPSTRNSVRN